MYYHGNCVERLKENTKKSGRNRHRYSWFQTFAAFWIFHAFFWVIPRRLNFICRRFGTLRLFHLHRQLSVEFYTYLPTKMEETKCSETSAYKIQTPGNYPEESIRHRYGWDKQLYILSTLDIAYIQQTMRQTSSVYWCTVQYNSD